MEDLTIDMQDYFIRGPGFAAIVATGSNWRIANCAIIKIGRRGILVNGGANGYIDRNLITKTAASPIDNSAIISVVDGKGHFPTNIHIIDNVCVNSMIYFQGRKGLRHCEEPGKRVALWHWRHHGSPQRQYFCN